MGLKWNFFVNRIVGGLERNLCAELEPAVRSRARHDDRANPLPAVFLKFGLGEGVGAS